MAAVTLAVTWLGVLVIIFLLGLLLRVAGLTTWLWSWIRASKEEKLGLTSSHANSMTETYWADCEFGIDNSGNYRRFDLIKENYKFLEEKPEIVARIPPQPLRPAPLPPTPKSPFLRQESFDAVSTATSDLPTPSAVDNNNGIKHALSCDSMGSDASLFLGSEVSCMQEGMSAGYLYVEAEYDRESGDLDVMVIEGKDLVGPDPNVPPDTYVKLYLLPDKSTNLQTRIHRKSRVPDYKEKFLFVMDSGNIRERILIFYLYACDKKSAILIGEAEVPLSVLSDEDRFSGWLNLSDVGPHSTKFGEILFSLSYLPTAERLTVVIVKARNLYIPSYAETVDPYVKVYLLQNKQKTHKKKTSVKRGETNPVYNEAIIFNVPSHLLDLLHLRIVVLDKRAESIVDSKTRVLGYVQGGGNIAGKVGCHWQQMLSSLRKPVAMWHPLQKRF